VASQVQVGNLQAGLNAGIASDALHNLKNLTRNHLPVETVVAPVKTESATKSTPQVLSHSVEFVALPGRTEKLCTEIPLAMQKAYGNSESFAGCIVLVSEQEARLMTVLTLWNGADPANASDDSLESLKRLLEPHVDSWMRTRRFISLLSVL
jgi:hypothetical protein